MDVALLGPPRRERAAGADVGDARRRRLLRLRRAGRAAARRRLRARRARRRGVAVLFVHAVNPTAFRTGGASTRTTSTSTGTSATSRRRCRVNAAYADVHPLLLPRDVAAVAARTKRRSARTSRRTASARSRRRSRGGQYDISRRPVLRRHARRHGATRRCAPCCGATRRRAGALGWIDFHTGARSARPRREDLRRARRRRDDLARARAWWGAEVTSVLRRLVDVGAAHRLSYQRRLRRMPAASNSPAIALEYGTLPLLEVLQALRADHWLHNHPEAPGRRCGRRSSEQMRDAFYVDADDWKAQVYAQAHAAARTAVASVAPADRCRTARDPIAPRNDARRRCLRTMTNCRSPELRAAPGAPRRRVGQRRRLQLRHSPVAIVSAIVLASASPRRCSRRGSRRTTRSTSGR